MRQDVAMIRALHQGFLLGLLLMLPAPLGAAEPTTLDKTLSIQRAMAEARTYLSASQPADAVKSLESVLANIKGDPDFLALLRQAYTEELKQRKLARNPDKERIAALEGKLAILKKPDVKPEAPSDPIAESNAGAQIVPAPRIEEVRETSASAPNAATDADEALRAGELFRQAKYSEAAELFREARRKNRNLTPDQLAAWAYCRVKVAVETWNRSSRDPAATIEATREIEDALALAPEHQELQAAGRKLITDVGGKPTSAKTPKQPIANSGVDSRWVALESDSFRVRFQGSPEMARELLTKAEAARKEIFARWSTPAVSHWEPKCDLVLHPTAAEWSAATNGPSDGTGHAFVKFHEKRVVDRRIDLRSDDPLAGQDALPRELTYIILADLFPDREPPRWAAIGMAVLATETESERCQRTLARCHRAGELYSMSAFLELKGPPSNNAITAYYVESASIVEHLVQRKDAKTFRIFLMDAARYGLEKALDRQYGYASLKDLDDDWRRKALTVGRAQKP